MISRDLVCASLMPAQGTLLHVASEVFGHAGMAIHKDVYEDDKRAATEAISGALLRKLRAVTRRVAPLEGEQTG
ncbi:hypothetical protein AB0B45_36985 [Nonomuraea sp. NPDC049152]|uniref:hypothetical protein n=1 Tax=Nonomuraea sp. NPDC049152 TaxID=3154350 RepID=UPI0033C8ECE3